MMSQEPASRPVSVVVLGHSYVRRLGEYATRSLHTDDFGMSDIRVTFVGMGGLTLRPRLLRGRRRGYTRGVRRCFQMVAACNPQVIILHIGENDLGHVSSSVIANEILLLITDLSRRFDCSVYISQLLVWPCNSLDRNDEICAINAQLTSTLSANYFWRHQCGLTRATMFLPDHVHLNETGMCRYYRSMRALVGRAVCNVNRSL